MSHEQSRRAASIAAVSVVVTSSLAAAPGQAPPVDPDGDQRPCVVYTTSDSAVALNALGEQPGPVPNLRGAGSASFVFTGSDPEGDAPSDVKYTPDGSRIVIAHRESGNLVVWDSATFAFVGAAAVSGAAQSVDITPDGNTAVVANIDNDTVSIVDLTSFTETDVIPVGVNPGTVAISPAGDLAAIGVGFDSEIAVIDIATGTVVRTVSDVTFGSRLSFSFEAPATSLQYTPFFFVDNDRIVNLDPSRDEAQFIDVRTGAVTRVAIPDQGRALGVSGDRSVVAVTHGSSVRQVTLLDSATETISGGFATPIDLSGPVALNTDGTVGAFGVQNATRVFNTTTGSQLSNLNTASINEMIPTFDGRYALGVGFRGAVIDLVTGALADQVNNVVSTEHGAVSPVAYQAAMCSTTFGDDLVIADINGSSGSLLSFQLSGPDDEGDRCRTVAVAPDGSRAVGVSIFSDTAAVVDPATGMVTGIAPIGQRPSAVEVTPDGTRAVVGNLDSTFASIVDLASATTTNVGISRRAGSVAISPDGQYAYLGVVADGDGVWRIDLTTNSVAGPKLLTGNMGGVGYSFSQSSGIAVSPDGARLAVAGSFDDVVTLVDTAAWSVIANLPAGDFPTVVTFSPDGERLYASNRNDDTVTVYDNTLAVPTVLRTINTGDQPWQVAEDGLGNIWVNDWGDSQIGLYSIATGAFIGSFPFTDRPVGLAFDAGSNTMRIAHGAVSTTLGGSVGFAQLQSGTLTQIDVATFMRTDIDLGVGPSALAQSDNGAVVAIAAPIGDGLAIVDLSGACSPADVAEPFGTLNFFDVAAFIDLYNAGDPAADLAAPLGTLNFFDISAYIGLYNAGCP